MTQKESPIIAYHMVVKFYIQKTYYILQNRPYTLGDKNVLTKSIRNA